jgi:hypothetical protein
MALENLKLLEEKLNNFLSRHEAVRNEKALLLARLQEREQTNGYGSMKANAMKFVQFLRRSSVGLKDSTFSNR